SVSSSNYDTAMQLAKSVMDGLRQVQDNNGFNKASGTFSTEGMDLSWVSALQETHIKRKAHDQYGDFLARYPGKLEQVMAIVRYEETHRRHAKAASDFLSPLDERDVIEIKYLMYTAEEPYRSLALQYLGELTLIPDEIDPNKKSQPSFFSPSKNSITYIYERDRDNKRGPYFTIFHELGHAIDYNYGMEHGLDGYYSAAAKTDGKILTDHIYVD